MPGTPAPLVETPIRIDLDGKQDQVGQPRNRLSWNSSHPVLRKIGTHPKLRLRCLERSHPRTAPERSHADHQMPSSLKHCSLPGWRLIPRGNEITHLFQVGVSVVRNEVAVNPALRLPHVVTEQWLHNRLLWPRFEVTGWGCGVSAWRLRFPCCCIPPHP